MSSTAEEEARQAGQEAREKVQAWIRSLRGCQCLQAAPGRSYLGERACARCGKLRAA